MAIYTPPSLPHTPSTLPPLPTELIPSCSMWRPTKHELLTPPLTTTFEQRKTTSAQVHLPPIASFDRRPPLTPPDDYKYTSPNLAPIITTDPPSLDDAPMLECDAPLPPSDQQDLFDIDWFNYDRTMNARLIAEKACEMVCWLWFATDASPRPEDAYPSPTDAPFTRPTSSQILQLNPSPIFVQFMQKLLETTQVSHSVIVLSLFYIRRLRTKARTPAQAGSEFRIAVAGLMMANKFLDDNTYTNKTWSDVSGIGMEQINRMEREFLEGVDYNLYVHQRDFESWVQLLRGLVSAKQVALRQFRKGRSMTRGRSGRPAPASASREYSSRRERWHRTRSTSPRSSEVARSRGYAIAGWQQDASGPPRPIEQPPMSYGPSPPLQPASGSKRVASAAFSPTSATFSDLPSKRASISLQIPEYPQTANAGAAASPMDQLSQFSKMLLDSPMDPSSSFARLSVHSRPSTPPQSNRLPPPQRITPQRQSTLSSAYTYDGTKQSVVPQQMYFYTLASSPTDSEEERTRKARLRCYHPPPPATFAQHYVQTLPSLPMMVHSAQTSPNGVHLPAISSFPSTSALPPMHSCNASALPAINSLPHFNETEWTRPSAPAYPSPHSETMPEDAASFYTPSPVRYAPPPSQQQQYSPSPMPVQFAPFANAGPPGVLQFYPSPSRYPLPGADHYSSPAAGRYPPSASPNDFDYYRTRRRVY
ncbi:cyclin-domain-containing protein [Schizophyllum commune]